MKTKEERKEIKEKVEKREQSYELTEEELAQVSGGVVIPDVRIEPGRGPGVLPPRRLPGAVPIPPRPDIVIVPVPSIIPPRRPNRPPGWDE